MKPSTSQSPLSRTIDLILSIRTTSSGTSSGFTEALARRDRLVSEANLRAREVTKTLTTEFEMEVDDAKNSLQFKLRQTEDKYTHRLARLKRQLEDRETAIDTEAHSSGSSATSKIESEEWVAEGKYEQTITLAKKELRTSVGLFAEIDSVSESLKQLLPSKMTPSENLDGESEDVDLAVILEELKEISSFHAGSSWAKPWKLPIEKLRRSRRANRDGQRVMFLREVARRLLAEAEETHQRICDEASELLNLKVNRAKEHISPSIEVVEKRKNRRHEKLEISYEKKVGMAREMHEKDRDDIELESRNLMVRLRTRYEQAIDKLNDETESRITETTKTFNETTSELAINWKDETDRFKNELELLSGIRDVSPLDWNNSTWQDWSDENDASFIATIGEIDIDIDELFQPVLDLTDLEWDGPEKATLPLSAHLPHDVSIMFEYRADNRNEALAATRSYMLRLMASIPAGKASLTIIDPVGLGESFAAFMHLADSDEGRILERIYTEERHIEEQLLNLTEHMEEVIQKYLRNEYATIDDYNRNAGQIAEPYRFLVMADFPVNLSDKASRRLQGIIRSGARCGVYVILLRDLQRALPQEISEADLRESMLVLRSIDNAWRTPDRDINDLTITLSGDIEDQLAVRMLGAIRDAASDTHRVEIPFKMISPKEDQTWSGSTASELRVSLGQSGANRQQYLKLGKGTAQHALIAGKTGSGKSTLLHVLITNLAMWHSPEEVEFYLVDFKKGVEFQIYARCRLPHARVVAVESDREFGLSVLQHVDEELKRRGELFREHGVQDLKGYRETTGKPLPRTMLIIDEFQEMFVEDDNVAQEASLLLDRLVRQGRAFGMHAMLGSQTLDGVYSLARSTMGQMGVRIALQCSEADSYLILSEDNSAARLLTRPGDAIYNDAGGKIEGNSHFQVVWLDEDVRDDSLSLLETRAKAEGIGHSRDQFIFRGHVSANLEDCPPLEEKMESAPDQTIPPRLWLGDAVAIKPPSFITLPDRAGANLLIIGQNEESAAAIIEASMLCIAAQSSPHEHPTFHVLDGFDQTNGRIRRLCDSLPHASVDIDASTIQTCMQDLNDELDRRLLDPRSKHPTRFLIIGSLQSWRELRRKEDDFSFSTDDGPATPDKALSNILKDGPAVGIHTILWIDTFNNYNRFVERSVQREFENRVLFQMSQMDSTQLIESQAAGRLGEKRAVVFCEENGRIEKFRPWGLASEEWLAEQANRLVERQP